MFNLNFKKLLFNGIWNAGGTDKVNPSFNVETTTVNTDGQNVTVGSSTSEANAGYWFNTLIHALNRVVVNVTNLSIGQSCFKLGTGTTTPTEEDYDIETEASDLVINQVTQATTATFGKAYNLNITNTGSTATTLREVVQVLRLYYNNDIAISRTAVSVSFEPGETKTIMVEVSL